MTDKLYCPWCNSELHINSIGMLECRNDGCRQTVNMCGPTEMWKFVIDGKKAQDVLDDCRCVLSYLVDFYLEDGSRQQEIAIEVLSKITSITKRENEIKKLKSGIPASALCYFHDGDMICCVFGDFINLQESPAGFGKTYDEAFANLEKNYNEWKNKRN